MSPLAPWTFAFLLRWPLCLRVGLLSGSGALAFGLLICLFAPSILHLIVPDLPFSTLQSLQRLLFAGIFVPALFAGALGFLITRHLARRHLTLAPTLSTPIPASAQDPSAPPPLQPEPPPTQLHQQLEDLRRSKDAAEAANLAKDRFLAVLSHELRTPLTPVIATLDLLTSDPQFPSDMRADIELIRRNVHLQARLIDDLLDLTRIAKNKIILNLQPVDLHLLLRDTVVICRQDLTAKSLHLNLDLQATHSTVSGDNARLHQILWNLLKNAIKFTPVGGTITLRTTNAPNPAAATHCAAPPAPSLPTPTWIRMEVSDTGIGIAPEILPRLFHAFEQGEAAVTREFGGLGLGLAISKALIDMHAGQLTASSKGRGQGPPSPSNSPPPPSPPPPPATPASAPPSSPPSPPPAAKPTLRILLVDDHRDTINAVSRLLHTIGHRVTTADSVQSALTAAAAATFDLVISDIGLPDGNGNTLMRQLKARYHLRGIALSGYGMEDDIKRSLDAGFFAHLTKPIEFPALQALLEQASLDITNSLHIPA